MQYQALATDYDGTIAHDGVVDEPTLAAMERLRAAGRKLILVTGREFDDLLAIFPELTRFDRVVAENGAIVYDPATQNVRVLTEPPPVRFVGALKERGVPVSVGRTIVATVVPYEHAMLEAIRDLGLEWHLSFNKGSVMALPSGVTKATGLVPALGDLGVPLERVVGVGDAENDHAFLAVCGCAVAVANALPAIKDRADLITGGARGFGVTELIDRMLADDLVGIGRAPG